MTELGWYYAPDHFQVWPALGVMAGRCNSCEEVHGFQLDLHWLWWGAFLTLEKE